MFDQIVVIFLTVVYFITLCVTCMNADLVRQKEGSSSSLFIMTLISILFLSYAFVTYFYYSIMDSTGREVNVEVPYPSHQYVMICIDLYFIIVASWSIYQYQKSYKNDNSISDWKKNTYLLTNVILLVIAMIDLGLAHGKTLYVHFATKSSNSNSEPEPQSQHSNKPSSSSEQPSSSSEKSSSSSEH